MVKITIKYKPYSKRLKHSYITANEKIKEQQGFLITICNENGNSRTDDFAPYPVINSQIKLG